MMATIVPLPIRARRPATTALRLRIGADPFVSDEQRIVDAISACATTTPEFALPLLRALSETIGGTPVRPRACND